MDCLGCATESPIKLPQSGCRCFCLACWGSVIDNAMASPKTSPVDIKCPSCQKRVYIRDLALVTQGPTRQLIASILKTIPRTSTPSALSDFCYAYDAKGVLRHIETNATFRFVNNRHYEVMSLLPLCWWSLGLAAAIYTFLSLTLPPRTNVFRRWERWLSGRSRR